jgi:hypothetical protein
MASISHASLPGLEGQKTRVGRKNKSLACLHQTKSDPAQSGADLEADPSDPDDLRQLDTRHSLSGERVQHL